MEAEDEYEANVALLLSRSIDSITSPHDTNEKPLHAARTASTASKPRWILWCLPWVLVLIIQITIVVTSGNASAAQERQQRLENQNLAIVATWDGTNGSDCGASRAEARANGCTFDIMRYAWVPAECYDLEAAEDALAKYSWSWYLDRNGTVPVETSELVHHDIAYTQWGYHTHHCKYLFTLAGRADKFGKRATDDLSSFSHAVHCGMVLTEERFPPEMVGTKNQMWYAKCGKLLLHKLALFEESI